MWFFFLKKELETVISYFFSDGVHVSNVWIYFKNQNTDFGIKNYACPNAEWNTSPSHDS